MSVAKKNKADYEGTMKRVRWQMYVGVIEYMLLRIVRKYLFPVRLLENVGFFIPYYKQNCSLAFPAIIAENYWRYAENGQIDLKGKTVLELGVGTTNATAYELAAMGCRFVYAYEPFARYNKKIDIKMMRATAQRLPVKEQQLAGSIVRIDDLNAVADHSIDVVLSNSVLEHVTNPENLFRVLNQKLHLNGTMTHVVDYRDHFFKYPYHMLLFSKKVWRRWLDPGDLPGWRLRDHVVMLEKSGFRVGCSEIERNRKGFKKIAQHISSDYDCNDPWLDITRCVITVTRNG